VAKGIQYLPVDGAGVTLVPCESGSCYDIRQCDGPTTSEDGQVTSTCFKKAECVSLDGTPRCIEETFCKPPCEGQAFQNISSTNGIKYITADAGIVRVKCDNTPGCYEERTCTTPTGSLPMCEKEVTCTSSGCSKKVPCCPKGIKRTAASSGVAFVTTDDITNAASFRIEKCGNPDCVTRFPCLQGKPCYKEITCPSADYPNAKCEKVSSCSDDCSNAFKVRN